MDSITREIQKARQRQRKPVHRAVLVCVAIALAIFGIGAEAFARTVDDSGGRSEQAASHGEATAGSAMLEDFAESPFAETRSVDVTLHPGPRAAIGEPTVVSFGAPFPPDVLPSTDRLSAFGAGGSELEIHAEPTVPWRVWPGGSGTESVRSAMMSVRVTFASRDPMTITLNFDRPPTTELPNPPDPTADWVEVTDGEYPDGTVREPRVYATFPAEWLSFCLLRTRTTAVDSDPARAWFDESTVGSSHTAVNDVPDSVTELIPYVDDNEPWLFDRTATLFGVYARTGDVKWLRHAHRSAQFYAGHIDADGYFDLKEGGDLKYSYGRSLLMDYQFTGDPALLDVIERIADAGTAWDPVYELDTSFWTERHQAYALLAALSAWEATGATEHAERVREIIDASFAMAADPVGSWPTDGCMLHTMNAHEGAGGDVPICSPWMSALFADAVWEYYIHTDDPAALEFLTALGQYVVRYGLYDGGEGIDFTLPWYLSSSQTTFSDDGPWGDVEHTCDVAGLVARAAWAQQELGADPAELRATAERLLEGCTWDLDMWHRPGGPDVGKSEWRLSPPRKFNWWFGTTSDLPWLMDQTAPGQPDRS